MDSTKSSSQGKSEDQAPLSNEAKVVESVEQAAINYSGSRQDIFDCFIAGTNWQISKFKNTDAVKVITDRIERRIEHLKIVGGTAYLNLRPTNVRIDELNHILKLIQP